MEDESPSQGGAGAPASGGAMFAVKTTAGEERAVCEAIARRAQREHAPVQAVFVSPAAQGFVFIEGSDFDRLSNLVSSIAHSRGLERWPSEAAGEEEGIASNAFEALLTGEPVAAAEAHGARAKKERSRPPGAQGGAKAKKRTAPKAASDAQEKAPKTDDRLSPLAQRAVDLAIVIPLAILVIGLAAAPSIFWDGLLYPYFWKSIEADASNVGGADEGYNIVNTITYALILVPALLFIWRVFHRLNIRIDARFIAVLTPFIVLGGAARALEDSLYFAKPLSYAFISPLIYLAEGLFVLALIAAGWWVAQQAATKGPLAGAVAWTVGFAPGAALLLAFQVFNTSWVAVPVPASIVVSAVACAYLAGLGLLMRPGPREPLGYVAIAAFLLLGLASYLIVRWTTFGAWGPGAANPAVTHLGEVPIIIGLAAAAAVATLCGLYLSGARFEWARALVTPFNALVYFGQFLDGAATYWGIDMFHYQEKHVLTGFFIEATGTAAVMFPIKLIFVTFVLYLIDVAYRKDLLDGDGKPGTLSGLLKLTVLTVGLAPGTRDMLRLAMGV